MPDIPATLPLLRERDPRFRGLRWRLLAWLGGSLLLFVLVLYLLARQQGYFIDRTQLGFEAPNGTDLSVGMAVKLSGFKIGKVTDITLNQSARVSVQIAIDSTYLPWLHHDASAILAKEGLIGDAFIEITTGTARLPQLQPGEYLHFRAGRGLGDIAQDIRERVEPLITEAETALKYVNDPKGDVRTTLHHLQQLSAELLSTRQYLDDTLLNASQTLTTLNQQAPAVISHADTTLGNVDKTLARTQAAIDELQATTRVAHATLDTVHNTVTASAPHLPRLLQNGNALVQETRETVQAAQKTWLLRKHIDTAENSDAASIPDSQQ